MRNKTKQNFYMYYILENDNTKYLSIVRECIQPERTTQYKRLKGWLNLGLVKSIGWCTQGYFEDYKPQFAPNNEIYINLLQY